MLNIKKKVFKQKEYNTIQKLESIKKLKRKGNGINEGKIIFILAFY